MLLDTHKNAGDVMRMKYMAILYRSEALTPKGGAAERDILVTSRLKNTAAGLTGFLHRESDIYYQWLEGPEAEVLKAFNRIRSDDRHGDVKVLDRQQTETRSFPTWSMGYGNSKTTSLFDWAADNNAPLHPPRASDILAFMKECAARQA
ncbi:BLUF domain-containing protein [Paracoccus sp. WLY502]|uniref:BLUF domain-containing protein n=1 Tax=Paracoccus yibinensis TaxID=3068891 RepID=UPI002796D0AC|nr:BLUF domain-containing protein [Paracoccus sp. WLY502]MDQ1902209.1 BLUF domain-containing protein [Paracoccus sp. WLY502]